MASEMENDYRQILYEKQQLLEMKALLEQQLDEASDVTSTSQERIAILERKLREQERMIEQKRAEEERSARLLAELEATQQELQKTKSILEKKNTQLTETQADLEKKLQEQQELDQELERARRMAELAEAAKREEAEAAAALARAGAQAQREDNSVSADMLSEYLHQMQVLRDHLDEEKERAARLEQELRDSRDAMGDGLGSSLADELNFADTSATQDREHAERLEREAQARAEAEARLRELQEKRRAEEAERQRVEQRLAEIQSLVEAERAARERAEREAREAAERLRLEQEALRNRPVETVTIMPREPREVVIERLCKMFPKHLRLAIEAVYDKHDGDMDKIVADLLAISAANAIPSSRKKGGEEEEEEVVKEVKKEAPKPPSPKQETPTRGPSNLKAKQQELLERKRQKELEEKQREAARLRELERERQAAAVPFMLKPGHVKVQCPGCQLIMQALPGTTIRCPKCGALIDVPGAVKSDSMAFSPGGLRQQGEFNITLPSQEKSFVVDAVESIEMRYLGYGKRWKKPQVRLKCTPHSIAVLSEEVLHAVVEWPMGLIMKVSTEKSEFILDAWVDAVGCTGLFRFRTQDPKKIFEAVRKSLNEYTSKEDEDIAKEIQKEELEGVLAIPDDFLAELRLHEEFNKILAAETKTGFEDLKAATNDGYKTKLQAMGTKSKKLMKEIKKASKKKAKRDRLIKARKPADIVPLSPKEAKVTGPPKPKTYFDGSTTLSGNFVMKEY